MSVQEKLFFDIQPPTVSTVDAEHQVLSTATGAAAANYDWVTALGTAAPKGTVYLLLEALTQDVYVRFKPTTSAAGTTTANGLIIKAGEPGRAFYVDPIKHKVIDMIAGGVGSLKVQ